MKKIAKFLAAAVLLFALGAVAALVVLRVMFPPEKLKAMALEKLQDALHREVRLASAGINWQGLRIDGLEISENPDFHAGSLLSVGTFQVSPRLLPLLHHKIEIAQVVLKDWKCRIVQKRDGTLNVANWTAAPAPKTEPAGGGTAYPKRVPAKPEQKTSAPAAWFVGTVSSKRGTVVYEDQGSGTSVTLREIELNAKGLRPSGSFPISLSFRYAAKSKPGKTNPEVGIEYRGTVDLGGFDPARIEVRMNPLKLEYLGVILEASGELHNAGAPELSLELKTQLSESKLKALGAAGLSLPASTGQLELKKSGTTLQIKNFAIEAGEIHLSAQGRLMQPVGRAATVELELKTNVFPAAGLSAFYPESKQYHLQGTAGLDVKVNGSLPEPSLSGTANLRDLALDYSGLKLAGTSGAALFSNAGNGASLKTSGKLAVGKITHPNFTSSGAELDWSLSHAEDPAKITGSAKLKVGGGKFDNLKDLAAQSPMARVALLPILVLQKAGSLVKIPLFPAFDRVNYKEITGDYAFQNGVMTIKESHIDSSAAYVTASGTADLGHDQLKMRLSTRLAPESGIKLGGPIGLMVTGPLSNPSVRPDVAAILKQPAVQDAVEQGKKILQNLFK